MDAQVRVAFRTTALGKYRIGVTLFCPTRMAEDLENDITCGVMSYLHGVAERQRHEETTSKDRTGDGDADES